MVIDDYKLYNRGIIYKGSHHTEKKLTNLECNTLLKLKKGLFVRNIYDFDCPEKTSFWFIIKDSFDGMNELKTKIRNQVRRSIKSLDIYRISKDEMVRYGYEVYLSSYKRYKNISTKPVSKEIWSKNILASETDTEYWGAFEKESKKLIAYSINLLQDNMCKYVVLKAIPDYLNRFYPFYGLIFTMNEYYLRFCHLKYVSDGSRSVTEHSNIQPFLCDKFNFRKAYCHLSVNYTLLLKLLVSFIYPFRMFIPIQKLKYLLQFEAMQRGDI
jgi:hypothetical protein